MYDTIIIGAGVAGLTAAIYAQRRAMKTLVISRDIGGQINLATEIENYPGFEIIPAFELVDRISNQVKKLGVDIKNTDINEIEKISDHEFVVKTISGEFRSKTLIIAMGLLPRRLDVPGEEKFAGKGISYCANCDGPFFKDKKIAVVGGGNSALDAAEYLSKIARSVILIHRGETFRAFEEEAEAIKNKANIKVMLNSQIKEIMGDNSVKKIKVQTDQGQEEIIEVDGVFIEIGRVASTDLVAKLVRRDEKNQIIVDENCATSTPGIFAAGDVTQSKIKQITVACGSGTIAALSAYQYANQGNKNATELRDYSKRN